MAEPSIPRGFDFTDPDLYTTRVPMDEFAELRRTAPVWWNAQPRGASGFDDDGYWVVTRHADVLEVSRSSDLYSSQEKTAIIRHAQAVTPESLDMQRLILLNIDPPQHTKLRGIVSRGFTPRAIGRLREALTARAEWIVRVAVADGTGDFVTDVAAELPLQAIAELLGIPQEDRRKIFAWSNEMIGYDDPEYDGDGQAAAGLVSYAMAMAQERRACPRDDIVTKLVHAQVEGGELSVDEFGFFVILLAVAGNETTRNILRSPNPHLGFGGTGTHYCLGANLAQLEIDLMFNAIADGMPGIRRAGDAVRLRSGWLNGIKRLPVSYR